MIKIGLIGMGYWGPNLARVLNQSATCEFTSCCDINPRSVEKIVRQYPMVKGFSNVEDLLASDVDAVVIATPISTHYEVACMALKAGKHVMVEKPLAHSAKLAWQLVEMAEKNSLTLMTGHTFVYSPPVIKIKQMIEKGEIGDIHYISLSRVNLGLYQKDVDVVWDLAVHDISILLYWLGQMPIRGASFGRACVQSQKRDVAFLWLEFPNGVVASNEISWLSPQKLRRTCVVGSNKMVVYDDMDPSEKVRIYDKGVDVHVPESFSEHQLTYRFGDMTVPYLGNAEPLLREVEHFVACIESGSTPNTSGSFGAQVVEVLEMVNRNQFMTEAENAGAAKGGA